MGQFPANLHDWRNIATARRHFPNTATIFSRPFFRNLPVITGLSTGTVFATNGLVIRRPPSPSLVISDPPIVISVKTIMYANTSLSDSRSRKQHRTRPRSFCRRFRLATSLHDPQGPRLQCERSRQSQHQPGRRRAGDQTRAEPTGRSLYPGRS